VKPGNRTRASSSANETPPPAAYAEWAALLNRFAQGEDAVLAPMEQGTLAWGPGVAERFVGRLDQVYSARKRAWVDALNRHLTGLGGQVHNVRSVLGNARSGLGPLVRLTRLSVLPEDVRKVFADDLTRFLSEVQDTLEREFAKDPAIRDLCALLLAQSSLNRPLPEEGTPQTQQADPPLASSPKPPGRRVIL